MYERVVMKPRLLRHDRTIGACQAASPAPTAGARAA
jgi:hypothetical protein